MFFEVNEHHDPTSPVETKNLVRKMEAKIFGKMYPPTWTSDERRRVFERHRSDLEKLCVRNHNVFIDVEQCLVSDLAHVLFDPNAVAARGGPSFSKFRTIYFQNRIQVYLDRLDLSDPMLENVITKLCQQIG